jgi:hypothetical protein
MTVWSEKTDLDSSPFMAFWVAEDLTKAMMRSKPPDGQSAVLTSLTEIFSVVESMVNRANASREMAWTSGYQLSRNVTS